MTKLIEMAGVSVLAGLNKGDPFKSGVCPYPKQCMAEEGVDCTKSGGIYSIECNICTDVDIFESTPNVIETDTVWRTDVTTVTDVDISGDISSEEVGEGLGLNVGGRVSIGGEVVGEADKVSKVIYIGHSGHTHHKRMLEHDKAVMSTTGSGSAIGKHHHQLHKGLRPQYTSKILVVEEKNLNRLVLEAVHMEKTKLSGHTLMNQKGEFGKLKLPRLLITDG